MAKVQVVQREITERLYKTIYSDPRGILLEITGGPAHETPKRIAGVEVGESVRAGTIELSRVHSSESLPRGAFY